MTDHSTPASASPDAVSSTAPRVSLPLPSPASSAATGDFPGARFTVFAGPHRLTSGPLADVQALLRQQGDGPDATPLLVFDDHSGKQTEIDLRQDTDAAAPAAAPAEPAPRGPGRPRLGVVAREVTLLPRHWEWLNHQPGGASVALRRLIDDARRIDSQAAGTSDAGVQRYRSRQSREAAYAFMSAMAGNFAHFEEASRALFAGDRDAFASRIATWPADVQAYALQLAAAGLEPAPVPVPPVGAGT